MTSPSRPRRATPNALAGSTSPYLLQHAFNPVDWRPWSAETIAAARAADRPLFVSIGYATCYWCHVMERESFEDEATAELLNADFVPIKIDREERPDIDDLFMTACRIFTRITEGRESGGWPLSVFVDPHTLAPFYVGTYFPPEPRFGRASFRHVLTSLADAWRDRRDEITAQAARLDELVRADLAEVDPRRDLPADLVDAAVGGLLRYLDRRNGGFGGAPKFPQPVYLELLATRWDRPEVASAIALSLDRMACGGIFDQIGGGFHRYAVDATWTVPHFEKMLYDNAQLASLYARSFARTGDRFHAEIARRTCDWVLREMTDRDGAFLSARDAEVDAREGGSYVWTPEELRAALAAAGRSDLAEFALRLYGLDRGPNFQDPHHPDEPPTSVLRLEERPDRLAAREAIALDVFDARRSAVDEALLAARDRRPQPIIDDKVLAGWNGLMIAAMAECGALLPAPALLDAARAAAERVESRLRARDGRTRRSSRRAGEDANGAPIATIPGFLEDVAALARGRTALARATRGEERARHLAVAERLVAEAIERFGDGEGGFYDADAESADRPVRGRSLSDGAVPSGTSLLLHAMLDLAELAGDRRHADLALRGLRAISGVLASRPIDLSLATAALDRAFRLTASPDAGEAPVRAVARVDGDGRGAVEIEIAEPWHLAADLTLRRADGGAIEVDLPPPSPWRDGELVHRGSVRVRFRVPTPQSAPLELLLGVQPCDESMCDRPREIRVVAGIR